MDLKHDRALIAISVIVLVVLIVGEVYIYTFNANSIYGISTTPEDDGVSYTITSGISSTYEIVITDNGDFESPTEFYVYYDGNYKSNLDDVFQPIGAKKLTQDYYVSQLIYQLENRGITAVTKVNADELKEALNGDISSSDCKKGLIVVSGALPDTVYTGKTGDLILNWVDNGGSLYWAGNLIGACYATEDELVSVDGYQDLFFGCECLNTGDTDKAFSDIDSNNYRYALSLMNNSVKFGVDADAVPSCTAVGYTEDGYSSIAFVKHGNGMICVLAGDYSNNQRADLAQIVSAGLCYNSTMIYDKSGSVTRSTISGVADISIPDKYYSVYVYLGGYYLEYARCGFYGSS